MGSKMCCVRRSTTAKSRHDGSGGNDTSGGVYSNSENDNNIDDEPYVTKKMIAMDTDRDDGVTKNKKGKTTQLGADKSHKSDLPTITVESAEKYDKLSLEDIKLDIVSFVPTTKASIDDNKQTGKFSDAIDSHATIVDIDPSRVAAVFVDYSTLAHNYGDTNKNETCQFDTTPSAKTSVPVDDDSDDDKLSLVDDFDKVDEHIHLIASENDDDDQQENELTDYRSAVDEKPYHGVEQVVIETIDKSTDSQQVVSSSTDPIVISTKDFVAQIRQKSSPSNSSTNDNDAGRVDWHENEILHMSSQKNSTAVSIITTTVDNRRFRHVDSLVDDSIDSAQESILAAVDNQSIVDRRITQNINTTNHIYSNQLLNRQIPDTSSDWYDNRSEQHQSVDVDTTDNYTQLHQSTIDYIATMSHDLIDNLLMPYDEEYYNANGNDDRHQSITTEHCSTMYNRMLPIISVSAPPNDDDIVNGGVDHSDVYNNHDIEIETEQVDDRKSTSTNDAMSNNDDASSTDIYVDDAIVRLRSLVAIGRPLTIDEMCRLRLTLYRKIIANRLDLRKKRSICYDGLSLLSTIDIIDDVEWLHSYEHALYECFDGLADVISMQNDERTSIWPSIVTRYTQVGIVIERVVGAEAYPTNSRRLWFVFHLCDLCASYADVVDVGTLATVRRWTDEVATMTDTVVDEDSCVLIPMIAESRTKLECEYNKCEQRRSRQQQQHSIASNAVH